MPFVAAAAPYIAMGLSAAGSVAAASAQSQAGQSQANLYEYNAQLADVNAAVAQRDASAQANTQREQNRKLLGRQKALYAKAGVMTTTGTPLLVQAKQAAILEMQALEDERQGNIQAYNLRSQAAQGRAAAGVATNAGNMNSFATLLSGGAKLLGQYGQFQSQGVV